MPVQKTLRQRIAAVLMTTMALGALCAVSRTAHAKPITGPTFTSTGSYTLSWSATGGDQIELQERPEGGTFATVYKGYSSSRGFSKSHDGE